MMYKVVHFKKTSIKLRTKEVNDHPGMAHWLKALTTEAGDLRWLPRTHIGREKDSILCQVVL